MRAPRPRRRLLRVPAALAVIALGTSCEPNDKPPIDARVADAKAAPHDAGIDAAIDAPLDGPLG